MHPILKMTLGRLGLGLLTLFAVSLVIFGAVQLLPGDVAQAVLGQGATPDAVAAFRREIGLDRPLVEQYTGWIGGVVQGDFGYSYANKREIADLIGFRLVNTLALAGLAAAIAVPLALTLGILAALYRNTWFDRVANVSTLSAISFPEFFIGYVLILFLAVGRGFDGTWLLALLGVVLLIEALGAMRKARRIGRVSTFGVIFLLIGAFLIANAFGGWIRWEAGAFRALPSTATLRPGMDLGERLERMLLPALTLTLVVTAHMMRMTRASIINLMASPYIEMARLKGISPARVVMRHALPNALAPIVNVIALNLAYLITGVVVVEVVFVYPGLGQLMVDAVSNRDLPLVQAGALIFAAAYILLNLTADILAIATNPRLLHPK